MMVYGLRLWRHLIAWLEVQLNPARMQLLKAAWKGISYGAPDLSLQVQKRSHADISKCNSSPLLCSAGFCQHQKQQPIQTPR